MIHIDQRHTVSIPGKFAAWFEGTGLAQGQDDADPECRAARLAWKGRETQKRGFGVTHRVTGSLAVLRTFHEYAEHCLEANRDDPDHAEVTAARLVVERIDHLLNPEMKED